MYFIYPKSLNIASEYNYNNKDIVNFFKKIYNTDSIFSIYDSDVTAQEIVDDIWMNPEAWYDSFIDQFQIEQEVLDNLDSDEVIDQINEAINSDLVSYFNKVIKENE